MWSKSFSQGPFAGLLPGSSAPVSPVSPAGASASEEALPIVTTVEAQPLSAAVARVTAALDYLGEPLRPDAVEALDAAASAQDEAAAVAAIQETLDPYCLAGAPPRNFCSSPSHQVSSLSRSVDPCP